MSCFKRFQDLPIHPHDGQTNIRDFLQETFKNGTPLFQDNASYIVSWYGKLTVHIGGGIRAEVYFVNKANGFCVKAVIPIELIPTMPIGSIWQNGVCESKLLTGETSLVTLRDAGFAGALDTNIIYENALDNDSLKALKNHYHISSKKNEKGGSVGSFNDANTVLTVPISIDGVDKTLIIHPLTFLQAHYGVSKSVSNILLSKDWAIASKKLHLDYINPSYPKSVFIPDELVKGDAVILYHLKNDPYTRNTVNKLNSRVRQNFVDNLEKHDRKFSFLKVQPYHSQPVHISCNYIGIDGNTLLCTEITGMSMPQGETVLYDVDRPKRTSNGEYVWPTSHAAKILMHNIADNEVMLLDEMADNRNAGVVRQVMRTIGEEREIARNLNISLEERLRTNVDRVAIEPPPEGYADGHRIGAGGTIGVLRAVLDDSKQNAKDGYGICGLDNQYQRLLKYAQYLKQNANFHGYRKVEIDCCDKSWERKGEVIEPIALNKRSFPLSVYVLRLDIDGGIYFFLDCESRDKQSSSGVVVKVLDEVQFLSDWSIDYTLTKLVDMLKDNNGRLKQSVYDELGVNGSRNGDIIIAKYKHMNEEASNWVLSGLGKFNN